MAWKYFDAQFFGTKTNPKIGDYVNVRIQDDAQEPPDIENLTFTFDPAFATDMADFRAKVKAAVTAQLEHLNSVNKVSNMSAEFKP